MITQPTVMLIDLPKVRAWYLDAGLSSGATLAGYVAFIRNIMKIPVEVLPDDDPMIEQSYYLAASLVNPFLATVGSVEPIPQQYPSVFAYAVYNLAGHFLVSFAVDDPNAPDPYKTYWKDLRNQMGLNGFTPGVIQSSSDQGTSQSFMVPDWMKEMSLAEMEMLKTPWGRAYMMLAQMAGPTIWGLTP